MTLAILKDAADYAAASADAISGGTIIGMTVLTTGIHVHGSRIIFPRRPIDNPQSRAGQALVTWDAITIDGIDPIMAAIDDVSRALRRRQ